MVKRSIKIKLKEDQEINLSLSKATSVKTNKNMIHFDQLDDGTWRLIYNPNLIPDFSKVLSFEVVREN